MRKNVIPEKCRECKSLKHDFNADYLSYCDGFGYFDNCNGISKAYNRKKEVRLCTKKEKVREHFVKSDKEYFNSYKMGVKKFSIRINDRKYENDDRFIIYHGKETEKIEYLVFRITYVLRNFKGLQEKYVCLSLDVDRSVDQKLLKVIGNRVLSVIQEK